MAKKFICLQAGHQNIRNNCNSRLRGSTGAPGEMQFNVRTRDRLSQILIEKGFMVQLVDANYNCDSQSARQDFDLFLAIHADANIYKRDGKLQGGGFVDNPDPSTDYAHEESKRIKGAIESEYFKHSGIANRPERSNANTKFFYMWKHLSANTPCVIIECGVIQHEHDSVILNDTDRVANAIARGICKAFGVDFDQEPEPIPPQDPEPTPEPPDDPCEDRLNELKEELETEYRKQLKDVTASFQDQLKQKDKTLKTTVNLMEKRHKKELSDWQDKYNRLLDKKVKDEEVSFTDAVKIIVTTIQRWWGGE